jgi:hypothetical protein
MALPVTPRWVSPVLVLVFALTTVWAGYNVASQSSASQGAGPSGPTLDYGASGTYGYVASLTPNDLFNSTTVSGTNITLFVPITKWINVTFVETVTLGVATPASLVDVFAVSVSTPAWSKPLGATEQRNSTTASTGLSTVDRYDLNVSTIEALVRTIDNQLNYSSPTFTVSFAATVVGSVAWGNAEAPIRLDPWLNLTFGAAVISPKGAPAGSQGHLVGAGGPSDPGQGNALLAAYVELGASVAALGFCAWLLWVARREAGAAPLPELDRLIEPYEEAIAETTGAPQSSMVVPVQRWEDLVKVADTLGRPILRPTGSPGGPGGFDFYVFDGTVAYLYRYPGKGVAANPGPRAGGPSPSPNVSPAAPRSPPVPPAPAVAASGPFPVTPRTPPKSVTDQLESQLRRIRTSALNPAERWYAFSLFTQAVRKISAAEPEDAQRTVDELRRALDRVVYNVRRPW